MNQGEQLRAFRKYLQQEERSKNTIQKYMRDVTTFLAYLKGKEPVKEWVLSYKSHLLESYAPGSVNSILAAINCYLRFVGKEECLVKQVNLQRQIFQREERELTTAEYNRLLEAAGNTRLSMLLQTICATGIRVSEVAYLTVSAIKSGRAVVNCKGKTRIILIPKGLQQKLLIYIKKAGITAGNIFVTRSGKPVDRSNIWKEMKALCKQAGVSEQKVFPHNLRHLFAKVYYSVEKDIVRLADLLGHASINTTRIYTMDSGAAHMRGLERVYVRLTT